MPMFSGLRRAFGDDLAGMVLDEDEVALGELGCLGGIGEGGFCVGGGEVVVCFFSWSCHCGLVYMTD